MARAKIPNADIRLIKKRLSWTRFHLPRGQAWPTWSTGHPEIGPLAEVAGCGKVWLGRTVDDPEQAALIILWESADALEEFKKSPACVEFLQALPEHNPNPEAAVLSGALLRDLSLDNNPSDDASSSSVSSRFLSFEWRSGFRFDEDLWGRVVLTAFVIPFTGVPNRQLFRRAVFQALSGFVLPGCEDLVVHWPRPRTYYSAAWAWLETGDACVDSDLWQLGPQVPSEGTNTGRAVLCQFKRWQGYNGATPEREEAAAKDALAQEAWARVAAKTMPPVAGWEQERWDIQMAPCFNVPEQQIGDVEEEDVETEEEMLEREQQIKEWLEYDARWR